jgi:hypothetical protein
MAARSACHDEYAAVHIGSPRMIRLFWLRPSLCDLTCLRKLACTEISG